MQSAKRIPRRKLVRFRTYGLGIVIVDCCKQMGVQLTWPIKILRLAPPLIINYQLSVLHQAIRRYLTYYVGSLVAHAMRAQSARSQKNFFGLRNLYIH